MNRRHTTAWVAGTIALALMSVGLMGLAERDGQFPIWEVLYGMGEMMFLVAVILGVGLAATRVTHTLDDAFDAGYRAGYRQGRRAAGLRVVPFRPREHADTSVG